MLERYYYHPRSGAYIANALKLSPTAFWGFQETSGNVSDQSGNGWTATAQGASITYGVDGPTINGETLKAVTLPGSASGYFTVAATLTDPSVSGFTVTGWAKHPAGAGARAFFYWSQTNEGTFLTRKGNSYGFETNMVNTVNAEFMSAQPGADLDDTWTFVAARYDSSGTPTLTVWRGATTATDTTSSGTWKRDGNPVCGIGSTGAGGDYWDGELALIGYWNTPLSDANVDKLRTGVF